MTIKSKATYDQTKDMAVANSLFAKAAVSYFYDSEVLDSSFVHLKNLVLKNPPSPSCKAFCLNLKKNKQTIIIDN